MHKIWLSLMLNNWMLIRGFFYSLFFLLLPHAFLSHTFRFHFLSVSPSLICTFLLHLLQFFALSYSYTICVFVADNIKYVWNERKCTYTTSCFIKTNWICWWYPLKIDKIWIKRLSTLFKFTGWLALRWSICYGHIHTYHAHYILGDMNGIMTTSCDDTH